MVSEYQSTFGLQEEPYALGFKLAGCGHTTGIGNSGPLLELVADAVNDRARLASSVLSDSRNFEGRVKQLVKANNLASPLLAVHVIASTVRVVPCETSPVYHTGLVEAPEQPNPLVSPAQSPWYLPEPPLGQSLPPSECLTPVLGGPEQSFELSILVVAHLSG